VLSLSAFLGCKQFKWENGKIGLWRTDAFADRKWAAPGSYRVQAQARDDKGAWSQGIEEALQDYEDLKLLRAAKAEKAGAECNETQAESISDALKEAPDRGGTVWVLRM
jgi:hypothetical protein